MSFELILPFLRPIESLLLDDTVSEIMGNPDGSWWSERKGVLQREGSITMRSDSLLTGLEVIANQDLLMSRFPEVLATCTSSPTMKSSRRVVFPPATPKVQRSRSIAAKTFPNCTP